MVTLRRDYNKCRISDIQPNTNDNDHWYTFWPPDLKISDTGFMAFWQPCRRRGEFRRMPVTYHECDLDIRRRLLDLPYASGIRPLCITIIGIPFGMQHFKMAALALAPFGKSIQ